MTISATVLGEVREALSLYQEVNSLMHRVLAPSMMRAVIEAEGEAFTILTAAHRSLRQYAMENNLFLDDP